MRIDKITISNFRGFADYDVDFGSQVTVLIGKNGAGKTNLISSLKKGLSFIFARSNRHEHWLSESNNCNVRAFSLWDARFSEFERRFCFPVQIDYSGSLGSFSLNWTFLKTKDPGSLHPTMYANALDKVLSYYNSDLKNSALPVLAFFSDSYPHVLNKTGSKASKILQNDVVPREFGYYGWDEHDNCIELWQRRYVKCYNAINDTKNEIQNIEEQLEFLRSLLKESGTEKEVEENTSRIESLEEKLEMLKSARASSSDKSELEFINERISRFTAPVRPEYDFINKEFQVMRISVNRPDEKQASIEFTFSGGNAMFFEHLPQGYKRLLSIVFDIAYRSFILNGLAESEGIVIIDEVELHLHPSLQQEILSRLNKVFPRMQFIVSTHSPLVISNLKVDGTHCKIIKLENDKGNYSRTYVDNIYGIDYTTGLMEIMEALYRPSRIDKMIDAYVILKLRGKDALAEKAKNELFEIVGPHNEVIQKELDSKLGSAI